MVSLRNTGQICTLKTRILVPTARKTELVDRLTNLVASMPVGDPRDPETQLGPLVSARQRERVEGYIQIGLAEGAKAVLGGGRPMGQQRGWFVEPTIFAGVHNKMRIAQEEVFGPVLSVIPFKDEDEAVAIGNDVVFGLAAGVWTQGMRRALTMADRLQAGTVWVNTYRAVSVLSPFGGYKRSGLGRENGQDMIKEYMQTKSVWISTAKEVPNPFVMR